MVRFHEALTIAQDFASGNLHQFDAAHVIRDLLGRVSLALDVPNDRLPDKAALSENLHTQLGTFSPGRHEAVQTRDDLLIPEEIFDNDAAIRLQDGPPAVLLVDRMMNNQDWLRPPIASQPPLPTAVAFSLKGGVGRSTTFAAWALHLADRGYKVLAVDLDLEAPGLQSLLLHHDPDLPAADQRPDLGVVDWIVESHVGQADATLFDDMLGIVDLSSGTPGDVHVVPAFGKQTRDYVAKLGRAYFPVTSDDNTEHGFAEAVHDLLATAAQRIEPFDVALIDARSGMHDIGAAAVTRLGAHAFLFARNDPQTWAAYDHLFRHLRASPAIEHGMPDHDLRWRLSTVGAMIGHRPRDFADLRGQSYATWQLLYDQELHATPETPDETDENMPHWPLPVYAVDFLRGASFHDSAERPVPIVIEQAYQRFFDIADRRLLDDVTDPT